MTSELTMYLPRCLPNYYLHYIHTASIMITFRNLTTEICYEIEQNKKIKDNVHNDLKIVNFYHSR